MRHLKKGRKFGRERDQRKALLKSMASSFFVLGRIETTEAKAKELRPFVERIITHAKNPTMAVRRSLAQYFAADIIKKIIKRSEEFRDRPGGYARIVKVSARKRDGARRAILELVK